MSDIDPKLEAELEKQLPQPPDDSPKWVLRGLLAFLAVLLAFAGYVGRLLGWWCLALLLCASAKATTYYVDFVGGSDSGNGLSTGAAWKHHPWFTGWAGSYTHSAGDKFIFKGGVTWDHTCWPIITTGANAGGTSGAQDYLGIDITWFAGSQWTPPIWDDQTPGANSSAGSIDQFPGGKFANLDWANYTTIDSIVVTNLTWAGTGNTYGFECGATVGVIITNCPFLCFSNLSGTSGSDTLEIIETNPSGLGPNSLDVEYCTFTCLPNTSWSGAAIYYASTVQHCVMHDLPNGFQGVGLTNAYNVIYNLRQSVDPTQHENAVEFWPLANHNAFVHHNIITNCASGELLDIGNNNLGPTDTCIAYIYDNVVGNNFGTDTSQILLDGGQQTSMKYGSRGVAILWNNTIQDAEPAVSSEGFVAIGYRSQDIWPGPSQWAEVDITNCFSISEVSPQVIYKVTPGATTTVNTANNLIINNAVASGYGFTVNNGWQPTSTSPTRSAGASMATFCASIGVSWSDLLGVAFIADASAYQFPGGGSPVSSLSLGGGGSILVSGGGQIIVK